MKHLHSRSLFAAALSTALLFSASHVMAANPPANEPEENAQNDSNQPVTDTWITTKVKADLLATEATKGFDINVTTTNGVVTLSGKLDSKAEVDQAVAVARAIKGVKSVDAATLTVKPRG